MGLLDSSAVTAIENGNRIRQVWILHAPNTATPASRSDYTERVLEDTADSGIESRVIDAGSRSFSCYNVSIGNPGDLTIPSYVVTFSNTNGEFDPDSTSGVFCNSGHLALPQRCILEHQVYAWNDSWVRLPCGYFGSIIKPEYELVFNAGGDTVINGVCTIHTESAIGNMIFGVEWSREEHALVSYHSNPFTLNTQA
jgi:hypothetical protein